MDKINELGDKLFDFVSKYNGSAGFWIVLLIIILIIMLSAISSLGNK